MVALYEGGDPRSEQQLGCVPQNHAAHADDERKGCPVHYAAHDTVPKADDVHGSSVPRARATGETTFWTGGWILGQDRLYRQSPYQ